jgi:cytoskeletal protein RodZ
VGVSIGDTLAAEREQAGLTVAQVSQQTRIRETIIRNIEHDDFSACGGDFYARGHIRSIARASGADPEPLIREFDSLYGGPVSVTAADVFEPSAPIRMKARRGPNWAAAMAVALALVVGFAVYHLVSGSGVAKQAARQSGSTHVTQPSAAPSPAAAPRPVSHTVVIRLTAREACWVDLTTRGGRTIFSGVIQAGTSGRWVSHRPVSLRLGNPGGVTLTVNGAPAGPRAGTNQPVTLSFRPGRKHAAGAA